jgi:hypothetical protein
VLAGDYKLAFGWRALKRSRHKVVMVALTRLLIFISVDLVTAFLAHISVQ